MGTYIFILFFSQSFVYNTFNLSTLLTEDHVIYTKYFYSA